MASVLERTILVRDVPLLDGDDEGASAKDKLEIHFGKRKNGGGEVKLIVCPFAGDQRKALVVFESAKVVDTVIAKKQVIEDEGVEVQKLPPIIGRLTASIDKFYWNAIPRVKCKELIKEIDQLVSGGTVAASKFSLKEISGTADELEGVQACILECIGLLESDQSASNATPSGIVERCAYIENLPLLSEDKEQLEQEIQTHAKTQARAEIERVICSIQGDMKRALAIFKSSEDRDRFLQHGDHEFFEETIEVKELPPVYGTLRAEVDIFFTKCIAKMKLKNIVTSMQKEFGAGFSFDGKKLVGTSYQVEEAVARFTEALGLPRKTSGDLEYDDDDQQFPTGVTEKPTSSMMATRMEITTKSSITMETNREDSSEVYKGTGGFSKTSSNGKSGSPASRTQQNVPPEDPMDVEEDPNLHKDRRNSLQLHMVDDHFDHPSGASNVPSNGRHKPETSSLAASGDDANYGSDGTTSTSIDSSSIPVDNILYHYIKLTCKDRLESIEKQYHVKIKFDKHELEQEGQTVVEIRGKKNTADVKRAKEGFWELKDEVERETTKATVSCKAVDGSKHKSMVDKIKRKFPDILVAWQNETDCTLFGETAMVQKAEEELSDTINCYESMAVDEIAFEYLTTVRKDELEDLKKKFNIRIELQEAASVTNQKMAYIKPNKATWKKKKCKLEDLRDGKEAFIDLYQKNFFSLKRIPVKCPGIAKSVLRGAFDRTKQRFPQVIMREETDEVIICTEEEIADDVVREFRSLAGLVSKRKLKKGSDSSEQHTQRIRQTTPSYAASYDNPRSVPPSTGEAKIATSFLTAEKLQIHIVTGDITTQNVDVIVNSSNQYMNHNRGVSKAICEAAGPGLQKECDNKLKNLKGKCIPYGECLVSDSYNLPSKHVVHAVGPQNVGGTKKFSSALETTFSNALLTSDVQLGAKSIAIPLIGSGGVGAPKQTCADALLEALTIFSENNSKRLTEVFLVNMDETVSRVLQMSCLKRFQPELIGQQISRTVSFTERFCYKTKAGVEVKIESGDITKIDVDIIVNAANKHLRHGSGVAGAISKAAGKEMQDECTSIMKTRPPLGIGECIVTPGYRLPVRILHIAGPIYSQRSSDKKFYEELKETFLSAIKHANLPVEAKTLAVPLISSGIYGGPKHICATALFDAIEEFDKAEKYHVIKIIHLINVDEKATQAVVDVFAKTSSSVSLPRSATFTPSTSTAPSASAAVNHKPRIQVRVAKADITTIDVDVIVNPTDAGLLNSSGLSTALTKATGNRLQQKCNTIMKQRKWAKLNHGEIVETNGYGLKCKYVFHTPGPFYSGEFYQKKYHDMLVQTYNSCLSLANSKVDVHSIAVPLIGAGQGGCPSQVCADALATAIKKFKDRNDYIHLETVVIVSMNMDAIRAIEQALHTPSSQSRHEEIRSPGTHHSKVGIETNTPLPNEVSRRNFNHSTAENVNLTRGAENWSSKQGAVPKQPVATTPHHEFHTSKDAKYEEPGIISTLVAPVKPMIDMVTNTLSAWTNLDSQSALPPSQQTVSTNTRSWSESLAPKDPKLFRSEQGQQCGKCSTEKGLKQLESCTHTFCKDCITRHVAPSAKCLTCHAFYSVVNVSGPLEGMMTYYIRTNETLAGEKSGAIVIDYNFPDGIAHEKDYRGRHYTGNTFQAYLPNSKEGIEVVWLLRTAFIAGLSFMIAPSPTTSTLKVTWSGQIPHKSNRKGGFGAHGYPDPLYIPTLRTELKKWGIVSSLKN